MPCIALLIAGTATVEAADAAHGAPTPAAPSNNSAARWLHTSGSSIRTATGARFTIKAVNWFGLETPNCTPHGLWSISMARALNQIRSFGFNTIRVPFADQCLFGNATPQSIDYSKNPALQGKSPIQILDALIAGARARGLRIILDRHRPDYGSQSALWYTAQYPERVWIADWTRLARRYATNPTVIGADLHNEPHDTACWGCGDPSRDWAAAARRCGNAVLSVNPHLLIIVEGIERQGNGSSTWWGGGLSDAAHHPIRLRVPHRLVYSAHDYPASVYPQRWFSASNYPSNLTHVWDANFGYLQKQHRAPVFVGEFGSRLETSSDRVWMATLVKYLAANRMSFGYWSYNPDSGDTGGLVADDWTTPERAKLIALKPLLGQPVPLPPAPTPPPNPTPPPPPAPGPAGSPPKVSWSLQSSWDAGYVAQIVVSSSTPVTRWRLAWPDRGATAVVNSWGMHCRVAYHAVHCTGADWAARIPAGSAVSVGLQVAHRGAAPMRPRVTLTSR